jgi:hypothetical protein
MKLQAGFQKTKWLIIFVLALAGVLTGQGFAPACSDPSFPTPASPSLGIDSACTLAGKGGSEAAQNSAKNNFCASSTGTPITIDEMKALQAKVQLDKTINFGNNHTHPLRSKPGPVKNRAHLTDLGEGSLRTLEGFVMIARQEGAESVNCGTGVPNDPLFHDIHISIVATEDDTHGDECEAVVAEMIPHHRPDVWTQKAVQKVAVAHARVRLTGQLFFDSSHTPCQGGSDVEGDPRRASLWEIHPIYKFDVCDADDCTPVENWRALDVWLKQNQ